MVALIISYIDGRTVRKEFDTQKDAEWYARNEGDHVKWYEIVTEVNEDWDNS